MSDRAAARLAERQADADADRRRAYARTLRQEDARGRELAASMTLAEAASLMRAPLYACACIGGPLCCRYSWAQARALTTAAHITIKMVADTVGGRGSEGRIRTGDCAGHEAAGFDHSPTSP